MGMNEHNYHNYYQEPFWWWSPHISLVWVQNQKSRQKLSIFPVLEQELINHHQSFVHLNLKISRTHTYSAVYQKVHIFYYKQEKTYYQKDIKVYPEGGALFFENILLEDSTLHKCIGLHTLGILNCDLQTIVTDKTGC